MKERIILFLFVFLFEIFTLKSQDFKVNLPHYSMINYNLNEIQIPGDDSSAINVFFQKWSELWALGQGRINVLHIGGSHVQADMFSNRIRRNMDKLNRDFQPSRGFLFPFNVAKTNNPTNYKVNYEGEWGAVRNVQKNRQIPVGVGGIAVYTCDPQAEIYISLNPDEMDCRWNFNFLKLIGYNEDGLDFVKPVLASNDFSYMEAQYDSIDHYYYFDLPGPADSFTVKFLQTDTIPHTFILNGFLPEKDEEGVVYHSIGVNGASVPSYLESELFEKELKLIAPDLVIFGIGINDASGKDFTEDSFINNYNQLIHTIKRVSPDCAFIFITNNDSFTRLARRKYRVNRNGLIAQRAFYQLAKQHKGGVWDLFAIMGGLSSMQRWENAGLAKADKIHFTRDGYLLIGDLFYNALVDYYIQNDIN